jgi:RNA polymerase primary sigma factor
MEQHEVKNAIQDAAFDRWVSRGKGTIAGATGIGKSRIAIMAIQHVRGINPQASIVIVVPTEALRDSNWPEEIKKWTGADSVEGVTLVCYKSADALSLDKIDLLILDEVHRITERSAALFSHNIVESVLGLSATPPDPKRDPIKEMIIKQYCPVVFTYGLDQGVEDGVVADFRIKVIVEPLDPINKTIVGGTKAKPFMTTEQSMYQYLDKMTRKAMSLPPGMSRDNAVRFSLLKRMRFIYNLPSKTRLAKAVLNQLDEDSRIIVFCGSIEQSRELLHEDVYNSKDKKGKKLDAFKAEEISRLGVVNAVDEGHNIPNLDIALIVQTNSNERSLVQRIGRVVRYRPGHVATVYILCAQGTVDETWIRKALENIDDSKIEYIPARDVYTGKFLEKKHPD